MDVHVTLTGPGDLSERIYRQLLDAIVDGRLRNGERLPPSRELAANLKVSRNTVSLAYDRLNAEGFTTSRIGSGTFVTTQPLDRMRPRRARGGAVLRVNPVWKELETYKRVSLANARYNFGVGLPDTDLFPWEVWRRIVGNLLSEKLDHSATYSTPAGLGSLRNAIARHIGMARSVYAGVDDIVVTQGTQQALDLVCRVLVDRDMVVAVEDPGYGPARRLFHSHGATIASVPVDQEGVVVSAIPDQVRLIYTTPSHQFPLGMPMSLRRRSELLDWADDHDAVIIEDDYDSEFRFDERSLEPLQSLDPDGRVIYIGTFSKTLLPALRVGFLVAPEVLREPLRAAKQLTDWHNELLTQSALARFMNEGHFARHLRKANRVYGERHGVIGRAIQYHLSEHVEMLPSSAGLHICALQRHTSRIDFDAANVVALQRGVSVQTLQSYIVDSPTMRGFVIGFGPIETQDIEPGIQVLAEVLNHFA